MDLPARVLDISGRPTVQTSEVPHEHPFNDCQTPLLWCPGALLSFPDGGLDVWPSKRSARCPSSRHDVWTLFEPTCYTFSVPNIRRVSHLAVQTSERLALLTLGNPDVQASRRVNTRTFGRLARSIAAWPDVSTARRFDVWTAGTLDKLNAGLPAFWHAGHVDGWTSSTLTRWTSHVLDTQHAGA